MQPPEIFTQEELKEMAGCQRPSLVIKWLERNGIPYIPSLAGLPRVHRAALAARMGAPNAPMVNVADDVVIDFSALRR